MNIKEDFHHLIDTIEDEQLLTTYYHLVQQLTIGETGKIWNNLTDDQRKSIEESYEESFDEKNLISHEEVKKRHEKWLKP